MPRRLILTTATLAAFLSGGAGLAGEARRPPGDQRRSTSQRPAPDAPQVPLMAVGGHLLGVQAVGQAAPGGILDLAILLPAGASVPGHLEAWAGRKNAWGSSVAIAERDPAMRGLLLAQVAVPEDLPPNARLWIGISRPDGRLDKASLPLPA